MAGDVLSRVTKRSRITTRLVEDIEPKASGDRYVWDDRVIGFGVRVKPSGVKSYILQYRDRSRRQRRHTLGRHGVLTSEQAREKAKRHLAAVQLGGDPLDEIERRRTSPTLQEVFDLYLRNHLRPKRRPGTVREYQRIWKKHLAPAMGRRQVIDIKTRDVERFHRSYARTPYQANRLLAALSALMNYSERLELKPQGTNPCRFVERYREKRRERYLSPAELARLGEVLAESETNESEFPTALLALRLLALTGMRKGEVLTLRWEDLDLGRGLAHLPDSKTGQKTVPLSAPAVELLRRAPRCEGNPFVCWGRRLGKHFVGLHHVWERIRAQAGIPDVRIHDLRHTFASYGAAEGLGLYQIGKVLGHTQASTTERYAHLGPDPVKEAADRIGRRVAEALSQNDQKGDEEAAPAWTH